MRRDLALADATVPNEDSSQAVQRVAARVPAFFVASQALRRPCYRQAASFRDSIATRPSDSEDFFILDRTLVGCQSSTVVSAFGRTACSSSCRCHLGFSRSRACCWKSFTDDLPVQTDRKRARRKLLVSAGLGFVMKYSSLHCCFDEQRSISSAHQGSTASSRWLIFRLDSLTGCCGSWVPGC